MANATFRQRLGYRFDTFIGKGGGSIFLSLLVAFVSAFVIIGVIRSIIHLAYPEGAKDFDDVLAHLYVVFLNLSDPGTMAVDIPSSPIFKIPAILAGAAGIVLLSMLIAFITTTLDQKITDLRKGHSKVLETGHTVILGWNPERVIEILKELIIANASERDACVVVLAEQDKVEMDDYLAMHLPERQTTRVLTRTGKVSAPISLDKVSVQECKSVIVLASAGDEHGKEEKAASDVKVIKATLALLAARPTDVDLNIVAEIHDPRNRKIIRDMSPNEITTVDTAEILAKILVQTSRSIGLSVVYSEIMSFDGCEMYFAGADWGEGMTFGQVQFRFPDGVPMGIRREDGRLLVNPPAHEVLEQGDDVLILAEDDSTIAFQRDPVAAPVDTALRDATQKKVIERELIVGWNPKAETILREYADYLVDGSMITVMCHDRTGKAQRRLAQIDAELDNVTINFVNESPLDAENLLSVEPFKYDNIIILSHGDGAYDAEKIDSETIIILLLLRRIFAEHAEASADTKLITEILDSENQGLISRAGVHDFIISTKVVSMLLAQISQSRDIAAVYDDLFQESGSEIYLKPASLYSTELPKKVAFADLMRLAQKRMEVCLGVKIKALERDPDQNFGVKLNPSKETVYMLQPEDCLVVLAEDET